MSSEDEQSEEDEEVVALSSDQRAAEDGEPVCIVCGRYGAYICDVHDVDVCSMECKGGYKMKREEEMSREEDTRGEEEKEKKRAVVPVKSTLAVTNLARMIGGLYGRLVGYAAVEVIGLHTSPFWAWLDPGAFALIGAASFFGGVSRLTMSLTVILMEMTNDIQFLLPIMVTIMVSKWVGDSITHPFYHAVLEMKCIPFLDSEPFITHNNKPIALELFRACDCMTSPVVAVGDEESTRTLSELLLSNTHSGFPIVNRERHLVGFITRHDLMIILEAYQDNTVDSLVYEKFLLKETTLRQQNIVEQFKSEGSDQITLTVDLSPFTNNSTISVQQSFSLHRTYVLFRTMGLRHLPVVDNRNMVVGIITRKDLMGHPLEEKLEPLLLEMSARDSITLALSHGRST